MAIKAFSARVRLSKIAHHLVGINSYSNLLCVAAET
jgi:hypothetical protein